MLLWYLQLLFIVNSVNLKYGRLRIFFVYFYRILFFVSKNFFLVLPMYTSQSILKLIFKLKKCDL